MNDIGIIPDTSVLLYYIYGNSNQKNKIQNEFYLNNNHIIINSILKAEIGRVIFYSFFNMKKYIRAYISNTDQLLISDFWIDMSQKISLFYSSQLVKRLFGILTNIWNKYNQIPIDKSDPNYIKKEIDRINLAINVITEDLLDFQEEISFWEYRDGINCPQANWEIFYNDQINDYELIFKTWCTRICPDRENKLIELVNNYEDIFLKILKEGIDFCKREKIKLDDRFYNTIQKLIKIISIKGKINFKTKYCHNLGDFLISLLLVNSNNKIYTLNIKDYKFILNFLNIKQNRIIKFIR